MLRSCPRIRLIALGGDYSRTHDSFGGIGATESIARISVDAAFVSTSAMTGSMTYHQEQDIVLVKRACSAPPRARCCSWTGKARRRALHRLCPLAEFDALVVDDGLDQELLAEMREHVEVNVAPRVSTKPL